MIRQKDIFRFIALLLFAVMTYNDTSFLLLDKEENIEGREIEIDEVSEAEDSKKSGFKYVSIGSSGFLPSQYQNRLNGLLESTDIQQPNIYKLLAVNIPLFIMYCALRIHIG
ncbi:MAG: hypothetical protein JXQ90_04595 [Cyclobacteriaceae bacterium]